ncbi:MAG: hypothetical protein E7047_00785 [Lentisphaerae bacterium]|nr:hypothetical protein [Lentisphaerota bacterium]
MVQCEKFKAEDFSGHFTIDPEHGFKHSGAIRVNDDRSDAVITAVSRKLPIAADCGYYLRGLVKTNNAVTSHTLIQLNFCSKENQLLKSVTTAPTVSAEWVKMELLVSPQEIPSSAEYMQIHLIPAAGEESATGCSWFDELQLVKYSSIPTQVQLRSDEDDITDSSFFIDSSSSKLPMRDLPVELKDGNCFSAWMPYRDDPAPTLEISWGQNRQCSRVLLLPGSDGTLPEYLDVSIYDTSKLSFTEKKRLPVITEPTSPWSYIELNDLPDTRKIKLYLPAAQKNKLCEMRICVRKKQFENYSGYWIWHTREAEGHIKRVLRKKFTLSAAVEKAYLQGRGDDEVIFYINGQQCHFGEITRYLQSGENILVAEVTNHRYVGGLLAELEILCSDRSIYRVVSDKTWKTAYCPDGPPDYRKLEFDDSSWDHALEIVQPPYGIWGEVAYTMHLGRLPVRLDKEFFPAQVDAGSTLDIAVEMTPEVQLDSPIPVTLKICRNQQTFAVYQLDGGKLLHHAAAGKPIRLTSQIKLSCFYPPGEYDVELNLPFVELSGQPSRQKVFIANPRTSALPVAEIRKDGRQMPQLYINGQKVWNIFYTVPYAAGPAMQTTMIREFHNAGCKVARVWAHMQILDDNSFDFTTIDAQINQVLSDDPDTFIILCFMMDRGIQNDFFRKKYPEEMVVFDDGTMFKKPSLASEKWHSIAGNSIRTMLKHIQRAPYAGRIIGYLPCGGEEGQWLHHWGSNDPKQPGTLSDYSLPMLRYFRSYLQKKYQTDEKLQQAWRDDSVTLQTAAIPSRQARIMPVNGGMFRSPERDQSAIDFGEALSSCINYNIKYYAKIIKEETQGKSLTGFFYGHIADVGDGYIAEQSGYLNQQELLEADDIDFFCGPLEYRWFFRDLGGVSSFDYPTPSMLRSYNKLWIQEDDLRTHLFPREYAYSIRRPEEACAVMAREFAKTLLGGAMMYLHEFGSDQRNWFDDVMILQELAKLQKIGQYAIENDSLAPVSEIAVIASEKVFHYMRQEKRYVFTDQVGTRGFFQRAGVGRIGAPFEEYTVDAFCHDKAMPDYKFYIFLNVYYLTDEERAAIEQKLGRNNATALWFYAPGYHDGYSGNLENVHKNIGINLKTIDVKTGLQMQMLPDNKLLQNHLAPFGMYEEDVLTPVFALDDPAAEPLAILCNSDAVTLARKKRNNVTHYYAAFPQLPPEVLRAMAQQAGVHIYSDKNDAVYVCEDYLAIHTCRDAAERTVHLPQTRYAVMVYPQHAALGSVNTIELKSDVPQTFIYRLKK